MPIATAAALPAGKEKRIMDGGTVARALAEEKTKETWRERRMREEREAFAQGKGYGDLIMDQIREVVGWDKVGAEGEKQRKNAEDAGTGTGTGTGTGGSAGT